MSASRNHPVQVLHSRRLSELAVQLKRSFLQYLAYTSPYIPPDARGTWSELGVLSDRQTAHAEELLDLLTERRFVTVDSAFPIEFATHHYVSLDYLMGPLIEDQKRRAGDARQAAHELVDDQIAHRLLVKIAAGEELILREIERLADRG